MFCSKLLQEAKKLVEFKEVKRADIVFVESDVIATMSTDNLEKLEEFVSESIRKVPNFLVTSTIIISREYKTKDGRHKSKYPNLVKFFLMNEPV